MHSSVYRDRGRLVHVHMRTSWLRIISDLRTKCDVKCLRRPNSKDAHCTIRSWGFELLGAKASRVANKVHKAQSTIWGGGGGLENDTVKNDEQQIELGGLNRVHSMCPGVFGTIVAGDAHRLKSICCWCAGLISHFADYYSKDEQALDLLDLLTTSIYLLEKQSIQSTDFYRPMSHQGALAGS